MFNGSLYFLNIKMFIRKATFTPSCVGIEALVRGKKSVNYTMLGHQPIYTYAYAG